MFKFYWEDFEVGKTETIGSYQVGREEIIAFAKSYDPQPFHIDEELAKDTFLGRLCASGWQTVTFASRIIYDGYEKHTALIGAPNIEECRWIKPVFPDDTLTCQRTCLEKKSGEAQDEGLCHFRWELFDQDNELKTRITAWNRVKKRP